MAFPRLFKQVVLGGLALAVIGGGFAAVRLLAADRNHEMKVEVYQVADLPVWKATKNASPDYDGTLLVTYIRQVAGIGYGDGSIEEHPSTASLVIRQTQEKHQKISDALERLRSEQKLAAKKEAARQAATKEHAAYYDRIRDAVQAYEAAKAAKGAAKAAELN